MTEPVIIQGGMGAGVSNWFLANTVSRTGQLGVVSGTALDQILARRLQDGDPDRHVRRAMGHFPDPAIAQKVLNRYFIPGGKSSEAPYKGVPMWKIQPDEDLVELVIVANFVEIYLAKEGHNGVVGINYLEKIQMPNMASAYGAMLAGVDYVLMGAGIPREIPGILDGLARHEEVSLRLNLAEGSSDGDFRMRFDPTRIGDGLPRHVRRPKFLAIVASAILAASLAKKATGRVDGFVVEGPTAGGHNAPPRGKLQLSEQGEPVYGRRDEVDLAEMRDLGLPFWLAGSYGTPEQLQRALAAGAAGIQVGTAFALCRESGLAEQMKQSALQKALRGEARVYTDPIASPTGFPFKVAEIEGTLSEAETYEARPRICDLGYLRQAYQNGSGTLGYRCPSEPVETYEKKGGALPDTQGRKCLCNALMANIGLPQQQRTGYLEKPLVTIGDDLVRVRQFVKEGQSSYSAVDVIRHLLGSVAEDVSEPFMELETMDVEQEFLVVDSVERRSRDVAHALVCS